MRPVDAVRSRSCIRCDAQFVERSGTVTRIRWTYRNRGSAVDGTLVDGTVVNRSRDRTCIRCASSFTERPGEISRLCPRCESDHVGPDRSGSSERY